MKKQNKNNIPFKKRKENLFSSLGDVEKFLNRLNCSFKYIDILKKLK